MASHRRPGRATFGVVEVRDQRLLVPPTRQVGPKVQIDHINEIGRPLLLHPEHWSDSLATVRGYHISGAHRERRVVVAVTDGRGDRLIILGKSDQFVVEPNSTGCTFLGVPAQQRLQSQLRIIRRGSGTVTTVGLLERAPPEAVDLMDRPPIEWAVPTQRGHHLDLRHVVHGRADRVNVLGEAVLAEDFHRPLVEVVRFGQQRSRLVAFHQQVVDPVVGKENRTGEATTSATDNEDRHVKGFRHSSTPR